MTELERAKEIVAKVVNQIVYHQKQATLSTTQIEVIIASALTSAYERGLEKAVGAVQKLVQRVGVINGSEEVIEAIRAEIRGSKP